MNEQIQKLYDQADKFAKENRTQTISGPGLFLKRLVLNRH